MNLRGIEQQLRTVQTGALNLDTAIRVTEAEVQALDSRTTALEGSLVADHGALSGLGDDDHTQYFLADGTRTLSGSLTVTGTVDGRDVATDGSKLDGIESGATADQTGAEIKAAYEGEADTNAFTDAEQTKLAGVESGATADQTGAEIKAAYEGEADTNAYTDGEKAKLTVSGTAPVSPSDNDLWMDTDSHGVYYRDSARSLWIDTARESLVFGKPGASGTGSGFFLYSANLNLGTYGIEVIEDMILDSVDFSSDGTTSGGWIFRVKKNGVQVYGLATPGGSYDTASSGNLLAPLGSTVQFSAGDRISCEYGATAGVASFTDASLTIKFRRTQ